MNIDIELGKIINPVTSKTFTSEGRWKSIENNNGKVSIVYNRNGLSLEQKSLIEKEIIVLLAKSIDEDSITIKSTSTDKQNLRQNQTSNKANLKVGHGTIAPKKRVQNVKNIIAISSAKGGVGKSTVTVNLAIALKNKGLKVGIIDADIYGPSIPMLLGKRDAKPIATEDNKITPIEVSGLKFISFGLFIDESDPVIWRGPMLGGVLNQFLFDTIWGDLDYLILDLPPGTGDIQLSMVQNAEVDGVVVVSTPQSIALLDTKKGLNMFGQVKTPVLGMIENMSYFIAENETKKHYIFGKDGVKEACKEMKLSLLGEIPLEIPLREGSDNGTPYMENKEFKGRPVWNSFMEIADKLEKTLNKRTGPIWKLLGK